MNLTQSQKEAKEAFLNQQQEQMLKTYNVADSEERKAVVNHIYAFLPIVSKEEKNFWLRFLYKFQRMNEKPKDLFILRQVFRVQNMS